MRLHQYDGVIVLIVFILLLIFTLYAGHQLTETTMSDMQAIDKVSADVVIFA